jgi:hypothetical protein
MKLYFSMGNGSLPCRSLYFGLGPATTGAAKQFRQGRPTRQLRSRAEPQFRHAMEFHPLHQAAAEEESGAFKAQ